MIRLQVPTQGPQKTEFSPIIWTIWGLDTKWAQGGNWILKMPQAGWLPIRVTRNQEDRMPPGFPSPSRTQSLTLAS